MHLGEVKPKNVVIQNQKALGDIGNLVNIPTGKVIILFLVYLSSHLLATHILKKNKNKKCHISLQDIARKAEVVVITILEEDEKSCRPHVTKR